MNVTVFETLCVPEPDLWTLGKGTHKGTNGI